MRRIIYNCDGGWVIPKRPIFVAKGKTLPLVWEECGRPIQIVEEIEFKLHNPDVEVSQEETYILQKFACGHVNCKPKAATIQHDERNLLWERLLPFQQQFVEFAEANNLRVINRDEMGLGKTIQAASVIRENAHNFTANFEKFCVIVTPVGGIYQWEEELTKWLGVNKPTSIEQVMLRPQVVITSGQELTPLSKIVIIPWSKLGDKRITEQLLNTGVASMVVDECHFYKDEKSARTQNLLKLVKSMGPESPLLLLSGTLVENRIMEMFIPLNLMDPQFFNGKAALDRFCIHDSKGKALTLSPYYRDRFFSRTAKYMIGRKKDEVNIPLPDRFTHRLWIDPSKYKVNEEFAIAYNRTLDEMERLLATPALTAATIIGLMQQLRHWTAKMKILGAAIWIDNWMTEHPGEKLAVGIHHIAIRESLAELLKHRNPLQMSDEDPRRKDEIEKEFRNGKSNLLICSIISAGVGRNFQFCRNAVVLERQWNRSKEDQFEQRFHRIITDEHGRIKTHFTDADSVNVYYLQGENTFDEFFDPLIHLKGIIVDSSEENTEELPDENFIIELAQQVITKRIKWVGV